MNDHPNDYDITEEMIKYGGQFVSRLGDLWRHADDDNRAKIKAAFGELWQRYRERWLNR